MANDHPFQTLFESFGRLPASHAEMVNRKAHDELLSTLDVETDRQGRCILLRAPRAGHGKTHLLSRVQHQLGGSHEFIPLHPSGSRVGAISVTEDALNRLGRALPAAGGLTVLDLVVRRLFSYALQPLVVSGEVPCQDREGALAALRNRPVETFDFHHPNAVTAHWARENFEVLGPRLSMELAQRCGLPVREVSFWVSAFFRYAATPVDHPGRAGALGLEVAGEAVTEGVAMERLTSLLALVSLLMRVVLVADDLEGFSADETAALAFAAFIGGIRHQAERVDVIISLNKDVWENAFKPRLSGGLADRLSEVLIELDPLTDDDIIALFESRVPGLGKEVFGRIDASERHARGLIRAAGTAWMKAVNDKAELEPAAAAFAETEQVPEVGAPTLPEHSPVEDEALFTKEPEQAPVTFFTAVIDEPATGFFPVQEVEVAGPGTSPPQQWGGGSVYDAQVLDEPARNEPFSSEPVPGFLKDSTFFQPPFQQEQIATEAPVENTPPAFQVASPYFQPVAQDESAPPPAVYGSVFEPVFEPASPAAGFGPPPPPQPNQPQPGPSQPTVDGDDRVDDLLKQFRERYGR
ncbi:MAG: hypothetical protein KF712_19280 [Akkermansiaceae bacterium]|nr:hypothetical protein [Akkermansiaceae bacterium]